MMINVTGLNESTPRLYNPELSAWKNNWPWELSPHDERSSGRLQQASAMHKPSSDDKFTQGGTIKAAVLAG